MELLLNLVWAAVAIFAYAVYAVGNRSWRTAGVRSAQAVVALACALVLLFPVISASDDLHPTEAVVEDAAKRMPSGLTGQTLVHHSPLALIACVPAVFLLFGGPDFQAPVAAYFQPAPLRRAASPEEGRAPPSYA